jgi:hypothetical protein
LVAARRALIPIANEPPFGVIPGFTKDPPAILRPGKMVGNSDGLA